MSSANARSPLNWAHLRPDRFPFGLLLATLTVCLSAGIAFGNQASAWKGEFPSKGTGAALSVDVLLPKKEAAGTTPMVVYLKNLAVARNSTVDDETILSDLIRRGMAVAVVDYADRKFLSDRHALVDYCNLWRAFGGYREAYIDLIKQAEFSIDVDALGLDYQVFKISERKQVRRQASGVVRKGGSRETFPPGSGKGDSVEEQATRPGRQ